MARVIRLFRHEDAAYDGSRSRRPHVQTGDSATQRRTRVNAAARSVDDWRPQRYPPVATSKHRHQFVAVMLRLRAGIWTVETRKAPSVDSHPPQLRLVDAVHDLHIGTCQVLFEMRHICLFIGRFTRGLSADISGRLLKFSTAYCTAAVCHVIGGARREPLSYADDDPLWSIESVLPAAGLHFTSKPLTRPVTAHPPHTATGRVISASTGD